MAIYYVDPYINATVGGIQGTNIPSARTGTWSDPFSALDMLNNSTSGLTTINGVNIVDNDEIRFKGLASFEDFVFGNIQTTYNAYYRRNIPSGVNQTIFSDWKTALNTNIGSYRGPFFISDTDHTWLYENIASTDIPKGLSMGQCNNSTTTTIFDCYSATSFSLAGAFEAQRGNLYLKLIKPTHIIKQTTTASNFLNIGRNVTYSAGWTSETTQNGQTVFAMMQNGSNTNTIGLNLVSLSVKLDLERLHFFRGNYVADFTNTTTFNSQYLASSYTHRMGTLVTINNNAWSYFYFTGMSAKSNINLKVGVYSDYYVQHQTHNNGVGTNHSVTVGTFHGGLGQYRLADGNSTTILGNMFIYSQYTGSSLIYFGSSTFNTDIKFLDKSYIYAVNSISLITANYSGTTTFLGTSYNYQSPQFQTAMPGAIGSGPLVAGAKHPLGTQSPQLQKTLLNPASWQDRLLFSCFGPGSDTNYIYSYTHSQINSNMGILETNGADYKTTDSYIPIRVQTYMSSGTWGGDPNYTFESNTYDKKVISTTTYDITTVGSVFVPLICYNDASNNLVIQCNPNASITYHVKRVSLGYIDITGKTNLNVSMEISKNINFSSSDVGVYLCYKNTVGSEGVVNLTPVYNSGTLTWTLSTNLGTSSFISTSSHVGLVIRVLNTTGGFNNTYTIKNIQYTLT